MSDRTAEIASMIGMGPDQARELRILMDVSAERRRQHEKFGDQAHLGRMFMLAVLMEEVGEVAQALLSLDSLTDFPPTGYGVPEQQTYLGKHLRAELVQVAAVAVQMIEHIDAEANQ